MVRVEGIWLDAVKGRARVRHCCRYGWHDPQMRTLPGCCPFSSTPVDLVLAAVIAAFLDSSWAQCLGYGSGNTTVVHWEASSHLDGWNGRHYENMARNFHPKILVNSVAGSRGSCCCCSCRALEGGSTQVAPSRMKEG